MVKEDVLAAPAVDPGSNMVTSEDKHTGEDEPSELPPNKEASLFADEQLANEQQAANYVSPPPNGGYGWVVCVAVATVNAHTWGMNSSFGVFLAHYLANDVFPGADALQYAFVGSLSIACALLVSPIATPCVRHFGTRRTMLFGVVVEAGSLIAASFAYEIWHLFLSQGVMFGIGMGFLFVPTAGVVPQWFTTKRSLANGISTSGSGMGGLLYSLATGAMIQNLGLSWTFRILGILALVVNIICTILVKDRNKALGAKPQAFDFSLLKRPEYLLLVGYAWFSMLGYIVVIFSLSSFANFIGLDASQGALISAMANLGQGIGRPLIGFFSDRTGRLNMGVFATFLAAAASFAIWVNSTSYGVLIFFALLGGGVSGSFWAVIAPITAEVTGLKHVPSALSLLWISIVIPSIFSEPMALQIVVGTGDYLGAQLFTGAMFAGAMICLFFIRAWKLGERAEAMRLTNSTAEEFDSHKAEQDEELVVECRRVARRKMLWGGFKLGRV